jgi:hypothetical protein
MGAEDRAFLLRLALAFAIGCAAVWFRLPG